MFDVITIGSATLDVFLKCSSFESIDKENIAHLCFPKGSKINIDEAASEVGGGATNSAVTFARQNLKTALICQIGNDMQGSKVLKRLQEEHIAVDFINIKENDSTDFSTVIWSPKAGSVILVYRGKSSLELSRVSWNTLDAKWIYMTSLEGNTALIQEIFNKINRSIQIAWNPGLLELQKKELISPLIPKVSVLLLNYDEAKLLTDLESKSVDDKTLLSEVQKGGAKKIIITNGHKGSFYFDGSSWYTVGAYSTSRLETSGAGDAFGSGFVAGLIKNLPIEKVFQLACANAASVVGYVGTKAGILKEKQLPSFASTPPIITKF